MSEHKLETMIYSTDAKLSHIDNNKFDILMNKFSKLDIFSFIPVPKANPVSTKRSLIGSLLVISVFLAYTSYSFSQFLTNNIPKTNQYLMSLDENYITSAPEVAFAFVNSDYFNESFYNTSYWTYTFEQAIVYQNSTKNYINIPILPCTPSWLNSSFIVYCPILTGNLQGILYSASIHQNIRIQVNMCFNTSNVTCANASDILWTMETGRLFVYVRNEPTVNFMTGISDSSIPYQSFFYFFVWNYYNRIELVSRRNIITLCPNLVTTWSSTVFDNFELVEQNSYVSQVPQNVSHNIFLLWMRLDESQTITTVIYQTSADLAGKWGGLWGIFFALGAFYFLKFNTTSFYLEKPEWKQFDKISHPPIKNTDNNDSNSSIEMSSFRKDLLNDNKKPDLSDIGL